MRTFLIVLTSMMIAGGGVFFFTRSDTNQTLGAVQEPLNVYFPIRPKSVSQFAYTESVPRTTERSDRAEYLVEQLIEGPSVAEQEVGFYSALVLEGESNCGGADFELVIDDATGAAELTFCRRIVYRNRGDFERVQASLARTLTELPEVASLVYSDSTN